MVSSVAATPSNCTNAMMAHLTPPPLPPPLPPSTLLLLPNTRSSHGAPLLRPPLWLRACGRARIGATTPRAGAAHSARRHPRLWGIAPAPRLSSAISIS
jgi:hypothetical protein